MDRTVESLWMEVRALAQEAEWTFRQGAALDTLRAAQEWQRCTRLHVAMIQCCAQAVRESADGLLGAKCRARRPKHAAGPAGRSRRQP